ncbi:MAG: ArsC/Spx/MgsR family protein [Pseudomonadota bacterium]
MITLNGLKTCDTCRRAMKALTAAGKTVELRDLRASPPSVDEITAWRAVFGESLMNTRSTTWRGLSDDDRAGDPVAVMMAHPALIKRPVITRAGETPLLGWTPATKAELGV